MTIWYRSRANESASAGGTSAWSLSRVASTVELSEVRAAQQCTHELSAAEGYWLTARHLS